MGERRVLVTGGAGFIGSHLVRTIAPGAAVTVFDSFVSGSRDRVPDEVTIIEADVRNEQAVERAIEAVDVVYHQAGLVSVERSVETPRQSHATNAMGTLNVLEAAREAGARVVSASSAAVYGHPTTIPVEETHPTRPTSPYGLEKLAMDHYSRLYHDLYGLETVALRYFNVYGPGQQAGPYSGVISIFTERALQGEPLEIEGDGDQTRDFVYVDDVVQANLRAGETDAVGRSFNIATGSAVTIRELAETIVAVTDSSSDIVHTDPRPGDIEESEASIGLAQSDLGYEPAIDLETGLERTVAWRRERGD